MFEEKLKALLLNILTEIAPGGKNISIEKNLFDKLISHLESNEQIIDNFVNCKINTGRGFSSVSLSSLGQWLIIYSYENSIEKSIKSLFDYLQMSYIPGISILAISGIVVHEKIQISDDIDLMPFDDLPFSRMKEALSPYLLGKYLIQGPMSSNYNDPKAVLIKRIKLTPKSSKNDKIEKVSCIDCADLYDLCLFLTLHSKAAPVPITHWTEPEEQIPCKNITDDHVSFPSFLELPHNNVLFLKHEWKSLESIYQKYLCLCKEDRDHLKIPINRLNQARRRLSFVDIAIDQGIVMEALFLNDKSGNEQVSMTLRLRASLWLGSNIEEREELFHFFNAAYSCRSKAVHTGRLDKEVKISHKGKFSIEYILDESDKKCVESIKKIIMNYGFPNWDRLLLGANEQ